MTIATEEPVAMTNHTEDYPASRRSGEILMEMDRLEARLRTLQAEYEYSLVYYEETERRFWADYEKRRLNSSSESSVNSTSQSANSVSDLH